MCTADVCGLNLIKHSMGIPMYLSVIKIYSNKCYKENKSEFFIMKHLQGSCFFYLKY